MSSLKNRFLNCKEQPCLLSCQYFPDACIRILTFLLECGMNVHHKCQKKVANLCGINQKLLAEALNQVSQVSFIAISLVFRAFWGFHIIFSASLLRAVVGWRQIYDLSPR